MSYHVVFTEEAGQGIFAELRNELPVPGDHLRLPNGLDYVVLHRKFFARREMVESGDPVTVVLRELPCDPPEDLDRALISRVLRYTKALAEVEQARARLLDGFACAIKRSGARARAEANLVSGQIDVTLQDADGGTLDILSAVEKLGEHVNEALAELLEGSP